MAADDYYRFFEAVTGFEPYAWQVELAEQNSCRNRLIRIPTGMGKTEGVLVEQTAEHAQRLIEMWPSMVRHSYLIPSRVAPGRRQGRRSARVFFELANEPRKEHRRNSSIDNWYWHADHFPERGP